MPKKFYCSLPVHQVQARENPEQNLDATDYNNIPRNAANAEKKKKSCVSNGSSLQRCNPGDAIALPDLGSAFDTKDDKHQAFTSTT